MRHVLLRLSGVPLAAALGLGLGACSGDLNPVRDVAVAAGVGAPPRTAPDFVTRTRPEKLDYLPVGTSAPARPIAAKPQAAAKAFEAEMEGVRAANDTRAAEARAAGASPAPIPGR